MNLSPLDIRKQTFPRVFRGYDSDTVSGYLEQIAGEFEECSRIRSELAARNKNLEEKLEGYVRIERTLNETLLTAQKITDESRMNAQKEAELIIKDAMLRSGEHENEVRRRMAQMETELASLKNLRDTFLARFKGLLTTQLDLLGVISGDLSDDADDRELPATTGFFEGDVSREQDKNGALDSDTSMIV
ncbi:MAG: DivIVA domain-containing protein [Chitinispirillaceae bacterium]|jgi:cell division initiation protein|nr:DivIVA domain-containing protein [Chitinispirillaceae bacterium]